MRTPKHFRRVALVPKTEEDFLIRILIMGRLKSEVYTLYGWDLNFSFEWSNIFVLFVSDTVHNPLPPSLGRLCVRDRSLPQFKQVLQWDSQKVPQSSSPRKTLFPFIKSSSPLSSSFPLLPPSDSILPFCLTHCLTPLSSTSFPTFFSLPLFSLLLLYLSKPKSMSLFYKSSNVSTNSLDCFRSLALS